MIDAFHQPKPPAVTRIAALNFSVHNVNSKPNPVTEEPGERRRSISNLFSGYPGSNRMRRDLRSSTFHSSANRCRRPDLHGGCAATRVRCAPLVFHERLFMRDRRRPDEISSGFKYSPQKRSKTGVRSGVRLLCTLVLFDATACKRKDHYIDNKALRYPCASSCKRHN